MRQVLETGSTAVEKVREGPRGEQSKGPTEAGPSSGWKSDGQAMRGGAEASLVVEILRKFLVCAQARDGDGVLVALVAWCSCSCSCSDACPAHLCR